MVILSTRRNPTSDFLLITQLIEKEMILCGKQGLPCSNELVGRRTQATLVEESLSLIPFYVSNFLSFP